MDENYNDIDALDYPAGGRSDAELGAAATVFKVMLEEMGIDPLDHHEWLRRFIESHQAHLSRREQRDFAY